MSQPSNCLACSDVQCRKGIQISTNPCHILNVLLQTYALRDCFFQFEFMNTPYWAAIFVCHIKKNSTSPCHILNPNKLHLMVPYDNLIRFFCSKFKTKQENSSRVSETVIIIETVQQLNLDSSALLLLSLGWVFLTLPCLWGTSRKVLGLVHTLTACETCGPCKCCLFELFGLL